MKSYGTDQVVDHTSGPVAEAVTEPVDAVLHLASVPAADLTALLGILRPGGVLVTTVQRGRTTRGPMSASSTCSSAATPASSPGSSPGSTPASCSSPSARRPLTEIVSVHERSATGDLNGKIVLTPVA